LGQPKDIYNRPTSEFVANFIGRTNLLHGDLARDVTADGVEMVTTPLCPLRCFFPGATGARRNIAIVVRPEHIEIRKSAPPADSLGSNRVAGTLKAETYLGEIVEYVVLAGATELLVRTPFVQPIVPGDAVTLCFAPERTIALIEA
jgi:ABC-type Fe3+/spermidine/putrescine transport system ATPase subunit